MVHAFHDMVSDVIWFVWLQLHHTLLNIVLEVPGDYFKNVFHVVQHNNLKPILFWFLCLKYFQNLVRIFKLKVDFLEDLVALSNFELNLSNSTLFGLAQISVPQEISKVDYDNVFVEDFDIELVDSHYLHHSLFLHQMRLVLKVVVEFLRHPAKLQIHIVNLFVDLGNNLNLKFIHQLHCFLREPARGLEVDAIASPFINYAYIIFLKLDAFYLVPVEVLVAFVVFPFSVNIDIIWADRQLVNNGNDSVILHDHLGWVLNDVLNWIFPSVVQT